MDENDFMLTVMKNMTDEEFEIYCKVLEEAEDSYQGKENDHE